MIVHSGQGSDRTGRLRRGFARVTGLALGIAMLGTVGLSGTLAQDDSVTVGGDTESIVNAIIAEVWAQISGGDAVADDAGGSGGGINVGDNTGGSVTMGGSGGSVDMGGSSGSTVTMGDDSDG